MSSSSVVIDASIAIWLVLEGPLTKQVELLWDGWIRSGKRVCAPRLWLNEVTSVIHKVYILKGISESKAQMALDAALALGVDLHTEDTELCRHAFRWATALKQTAAYDGFYLALAEQLDAAFWTTDRGLHNQARQIGVEWVHGLSET
jgi:predicted nucleic acid-binding protein